MTLSKNSDVRNNVLESSGVLSAGSIFQTFEAMCGLKRPNSEMGWESFLTSRKVAWKTGTSFGQRDAWAVGVTPEYVIGVWVGNADGTGRPGNTGISSAAPIYLTCSISYLVLLGLTLHTMTYIK